MITIDLDDGFNRYEATLDRGHISVTCYPPFSHIGEERDFRWLDQHIQTKIVNKLAEALKIERELRAKANGGDCQ